MHYHAQHRVLKPADDTVSVTPVSGDSGHERRISDDGQYAVRVTTLGSAH